MLACARSGCQIRRHLGPVALDAPKQTGLYGRSAGILSLLFFVDRLHDGMPVSSGERLSPLPGGIRTLLGHNLVPPERLPGEIHVLRWQVLADHGHVGRKAELGDALTEAVEVEAIILDGCP